MAINDDQVAGILVIDDDVVTRTMLSKTLTNSGYRVEVSASGEDGIAKLKKLRPDLVLLDVVMPGLDGFETCSRIREFASYADTPIIMLTGLNDIKSVDAAFEVGANDFITKPINWSLLVKRVRYAIRDRKLNQQLIENEAKLRQSQRIAQLAYWELNLLDRMITISDDSSLVNIIADNGRVSLDDFLDQVHLEDREMVATSLEKVLHDGGHCQIDYRIMLKEGGELILAQHAEAIKGDNHAIMSVLGTLQDITKQKHAEFLIEFQRNYDQLTNLPNKNYFLDEFDKRQAGVAGDGQQLAVLFFGVDRFKSINQSLGYQVGDILLQFLAGKLKDIFQNRGFVSRYAGDTFAVLVSAQDGIEQLDSLMKQALDSLGSAYNIFGEKVYCTVSVGVSIYPDETGSAEQLAGFAETAMGMAKNNGGSCIFYHSEKINTHAKQCHAIDNHLRYALEHGGLHLHYQPQVSLDNGKIIGAEALLRLELADGKWMSPAEFIPVAEETGVIVPIGYWIIDSACKQIRNWLDTGIEDLRVGINLSARQFVDPNIVRKMDDIIGKYHIPPHLIDVEITESVAMGDMDKALAILHQFKEYGYAISMDDFGTGHSCLSYLKLLPIDILKIDRAFIKDISDNGDNGEIAKTIIDMAHNLNLGVIAEGAETDSHISFLKNHDCDEVQGFYYSKPLSVDAFNQFYAEFGSSAEQAPMAKSQAR